MNGSVCWETKKKNRTKRTERFYWYHPHLRITITNFDNEEIRILMTNERNGTEPDWSWKRVSAICCIWMTIWKADVSTDVHPTSNWGSGLWGSRVHGHLCQSDLRVLEHTEIITLVLLGVGKKCSVDKFNERLTLRTWGQVNLSHTFPSEFSSEASAAFLDAVDMWLRFIWQSLNLHW